MRILAIRGQNIASLAEPFELRLDAEPLASSRIFAIVGPTGAGKSTLLDALCLALFHRTPRLGERSGGTDVGLAGGDERLKSYDVRGLLHRGASSCFAECDFEGTDGGLYRARWSVRRAHAKKGGALQNPRTALQHLDTGVAIGRTKTDVADEIVERLGLNFEQFRRSVLLAQGDFSAFLRARGDERAALLERMTATPIYAQLSIAAHEKAREKRNELDQHRALMAAVAPLEREALDELLAAEKSAGKDVLTLQTSLREVQATVAVLEQDAQLDEEIALAAESVRTQREVLAASKERQEQLAIAERAAVFRDALASLDEATRRAEVAKEEVASAKRQREICAQQTLAQRAEGERLAAERRAFDAAAGAFDVALSAAEKSDREIDIAQRDLERRRAESDELQKHLDKLGSEMLELRAEQRTLAAQEAEARAWTDRRAYRRDTESGPQRALAAIKAEREAHTKVGALAARAESLRSEIAQRQTSRDALVEQVRTSKRALEEANARLENAQSGVGAPVLRAAQSALAEVVVPARILLELEQRAKSLGAEYRAADEARRAAAELASRASADAATAIQALEEAKRNQDAARARLEQARAAESAAALRATLDPESPCPVCGSLDHPGTEDDPLVHLVEQLAAELTAQGERCAEHEARATSAQSADATCRAALAKADGVALGLSEAHRESEAKLQSGRTALEAASVASRAQLRDLGLDADEWRSTLEADWATPEGTLELERRLARVEGQLQSAFAAQALASQLAREKEEANATREGAERQLDASEHGLTTLKASLAELSLAQEAAGASLHERTRDADMLCGDGWQDADFAEQLERERDDLPARVAADATRRSASERVAARLEERDAERTRVDTALLAANVEQRSSEERLTVLKARRSEMLEGRSVGEARKARAARDLDLRERQASHQQRLSTAEGVEASASAVAETRAESAAREDRARERAKSEFDARAAKAGLREDEIRSQLALNLDIEAEKRALDELARAVSHAAMRMDQRRQDRQTLRARHPALFGLDAGPQADLFGTGDDEPVATPIETIDTRRARVRELEEALTAAQEELATLRASLAQDDKARLESMRLEEILKAMREEVAVWGELADLIGSSDGRRFRAFAQSVTLDILLGRANTQLARLFPRYELERAPGSDLGLQVVDLDMGGVIRSVDTLSGGETFVVSLALALALAGLSARTTPLRTLFIDEGFGALDAASLEAVLDVLDTIQAEGKQVGIISHVAEIAERFRVRVHVTREHEGRSRVSIHPASVARDDAVAE